MKERWNNWRTDQGDRVDGGFWRWLIIILGVYLVIMMIVGIVVSSEPDPFDVRQEFAERYPGQDPVIGSLTTQSLIVQMETLLDKPWGYTANDVTPPGVWLDNIPNWEYGALVQIRDLSKAMREQFSRSQTQSTEDETLKKAEPNLNYNHLSWLLPASEGQYRDSVRYLEDYLERLNDESNQRAQFFARADNLNAWLTTVGSRLGSYSQRLAASVGEARINTDLAGDTAAQQSTASAQMVYVGTPWLEIDDVFYEARGYCWGLAQTLKAIEFDFADVLEKKRAQASLEQIIRELEGTQREIWSPMILNGSGYGMLANHSLVLSNYISRANAALIDLRDLLNNG
nr:DUF2333 family protein [uncultured Umboniibacter sp.]